jgi:hypothetical protein
MRPNPFAILGLPEWPDLDDETVHAAWAAIAAETHPDRADGGDLARYTQATAAYAELDTAWGRSEAYADLVAQALAGGRYDDYPDTGLHPGTGFGLFVVDAVSLPPDSVVVVLQPVPFAEVLRMAAEIPGRIRRGHPWRLLIQAAVLAGLALAVLAIFPAVPPLWAAAMAAILLVLSGREDMAPPPGCQCEKNPETEKHPGREKG